MVRHANQKIEKKRREIARKVQRHDVQADNPSQKEYQQKRRSHTQLQENGQCSRVRNGNEISFIDCPSSPMSNSKIVTDDHI
jgi:hypothetical protein